MKNVRVNKSDLLVKLRENKEVHEQEFKELQVIYNDDAITGLEGLLAEAKKRPETPELYLRLEKPISYTESYDLAIGMLEMSIDEIFEISQEEYKNYVLNIWSWTNNFENIKSSYSMR